MCPLRPYRWSIVFCAIMMLGGAVACQWPSWYVKDNPVEQKVEQLIEEETGIDIDLSP
jgi:hypothetical protein